MPRILLTAFAAALLQAGASGQSTFINELHYDNEGIDRDEGVEIAGAAGTDLTSFKLVFYSGADGATYGELPLGGIIPAQNGTAFGTAFFARAGIQNGAPDGIALIDTTGNSVVQFLSYEGSFTATDGDAIGESSDDIGVRETSSGRPGDSLQLAGSGAVYGDFTWQTPGAASPASINSGQTFIGAGSPAITLSFIQSRIAEGTGGSATISLFPNPPAPTAITISNPDPSELAAPTSIIIPISGSATFVLTAVDDSLNDGHHQVTITASDPGGIYTPASATALVLDTQRPSRGTAIRLASVNSLRGVGARDSPEYAALLALIGRIEPDIIAFQEVSSSGDFFDLRTLAADLGIPYVATTGDGFLDAPYEGGSFDSDQNLAVASIFPITSTTQIGRGQPGRKELTRFPLLVEIDVPGTTNDPTIVAVHYKASFDHASRFRKAVEAYRTIGALGAAGHSGAADNLFILGDFNEDHDRFMETAYHTGIDTSSHTFADGSKLPISYQLGPDISGANAITLPYAQFPDQPFAAADVVTPNHRQQDNAATRTYIPLGDAALDYILHSQTVATNGNTHTEIYNSSLDRAFDGLEKQGDPPAPNTSFTASDHFAIFGDYELDPKPALALKIAPFGHSEDAGPGAATGTLTLSIPAATELEVRLAKLRPDAPVGLPPGPLTFVAGETSKSFPIDILDRPTAAPDRTVTITASAERYSGTSDTLLVYNLEPSGRILISQYAEPPSGSAPRGIELFNGGPEAIDLAGEPIRVVQYTNGADSGHIEGVAESGIFPAGGVIVIGDAQLGDYLVARGLLPAPWTPFVDAENGSPYLNASGELVFVKEFFPYNGDDALEVQIAFELSDVFGTIGQDPGTSWQSGGVSTRDRNLSLRDDVATASAGFTRPHLRFTDTAAGDDLSGFGSPPAADDPFRNWLLGFGLADPNADPDRDGISNLVEFATGSDPTDAGSANRPATGAMTISHRQRISPGRLLYTIELSDDLLEWRGATPDELTLAGRSPDPDGTTATVTYTHSLAPPAFVRLRITLP